MGIFRFVDFNIINFILNGWAILFNGSDTKMVIVTAPKYIVYPKRNGIYYLWISY
uniref:Uncharacterized protein n=1 Tax=Meloidogyne enterolobii TaxID=390850 RepID=A0A6V7X7V2_MELEN|nr:unnamed protein product [Meloidogyne enterolobii]